MASARALTSEFSKRLFVAAGMETALSGGMLSARRRVLLFLLCAVVLLGAGYAAGYANAYGRFYSPEALLDRELLHLDFNTRLLHYSLLGRQTDCRRELVRRLQGEVTFVGEQMGDGLGPGSQAIARVSLERARTVMSGQTLAPGEKPRD